MKWWQRYRQARRLQAAVLHNERTLELMKDRLADLLERQAKPEVIADQQGNISWQKARLRKAQRELQDFERSRSRQ